MVYEWSLARAVDNLGVPLRCILDVGVPLLDRTQQMTSEFEGEAYDRAMDSLTRSQRNELLGDVSRKRAEAKLYTRQMAEGPNATAKRGFWLGLFKYTLLAIGWTIEITGQIHVIIGQGLRKWGESL